MTCKSATDHHKTMQIIEILLYAFGDEMLRVYAKETNDMEVCFKHVYCTSMMRLAHHNDAIRSIHILLCTFGI